jgi:hypothetical protein
LCLPGVPKPSVVMVHQVLCGGGGSDNIE